MDKLMVLPEPVMLDDNTTMIMTTFDDLSAEEYAGIIDISMPYLSNDEVSLDEMVDLINESYHIPYIILVLRDNTPIAFALFAKADVNVTEYEAYQLYLIISSVKRQYIGSVMIEFMMNTLLQNQVEETAVIVQSTEEAVPFYQQNDFVEVVPYNFYRLII